jgi:hypothetical protein
VDRPQFPPAELWGSGVKFVHNPPMSCSLIPGPAGSVRPFPRRPAAWGRDRAPGVRGNVVGKGATLRSFPGNANNSYKAFRMLGLRREAPRGEIRKKLAALAALN